MSEPLVSVIMPVYNVERYLGQAIQSAVDQTYGPLDILVVDDGSSDGSASVARSFAPHVRYHFQENAGLSAARNTGVELAKGELLAFLDSDDWWEPGKIALQVAAFRADPELDMVLGHVRQFHSPDLDDELKTRLRCDTAPMPGHLASTLLIRRRSFYRVGRFALDLRVGEFVDWYAKAVDRGLKSTMLSETVLNRRIHADNMGRRDRDKRSDYLRVLKATLDRRRQQRV